MKINILFAVLFTAFSFYSCDNSRETEQQWLDFQESRSFDNSEYSISFSNVVKDTRCPVLATCSSPGHVIVKMSTLDYDVTRSVELKEGERYPKEPNSFELGIAFTILKVSPYPDISGPFPDEDYKVLLEISYQ